MNKWENGWIVAAVVVVVAIGAFVLQRRNRAKEAQRLANLEADRRRAAADKARADAAAEEERLRAAKVVKVIEVEPAPLVVPGGNILERASEIGVDPVIDDSIHLFPQRATPVTRFEDLNRLLFIAYIDDTQKTTIWPETRARDFATNIIVKSEEEINSHIFKRLRPKYPVIYDPLGYWSASSAKLEMSPDEPDLVADAYLALPPQERPVVISLKRPIPNSKLAFHRYGFEPFAVSPAQLTPFGGDALSYIFKALTGERREWKKLSIARMRQALGRQRKEIEEQNQVEQVLKAETARLAHENRFVTLFNLVERPVPEITETPQPEATN